MSGTSFSDIAAKYDRLSIVQTSASEVLIDILAVAEGEDVLDLGCGTGQLTRTLRDLTRGRVVGVDSSHGMIEEANKNHARFDIEFEVMGAEDLSYDASFDVIFSNSSFQWFTEPERVVSGCYRALKPGGRFGMQAPARQRYCPNFLNAIERVKADPRTGNTFARFKAPWLLLETAEEYAAIFQQGGFQVPFSGIDVVRTLHGPEEVLGLFESGAAAGYLNPAYYDIGLNESCISDFLTIMANAFRSQADDQGNVELVFNRVYLFALKA